MKIPPWLHEFIRKLPRDYQGKLTLEFDGTGGVEVERKEKWTEEIFCRRYKEYHPKPEKGQSNGYESNDGSLVDQQHE